MRAIETIYQEMLAAYAERRGGQIEEDCELAVRLWAAAAQVQALEAQADWVLAQSFPQTAAGEYLGPPCRRAGSEAAGGGKSSGNADIYGGYRADGSADRTGGDGLHDRGGGAVSHHGAGDNSGGRDLCDRGGGSRGDRRRRKCGRGGCPMC